MLAPWRILAIGGLLLVALLLIAAPTSFVPAKSGKQNNLTNGSGTGENGAVSSPTIPGNAFSRQPFLPTQPSAGFVNGRTKSSSSSGNALFAPGSQFQGLLPSLNDIEEAVSSSLPKYFSGTSSGSDLLPLPPTADSEMALNEDGAKDVVGYFKYLAMHYLDVNFDYKKLNTTLRSGDKFYPSPASLVEDALSGGGAAVVLKSLDIFKEFVLAKIELEKSMHVAGQGVSVNRTMISLDKLTAQLIDKFRNFQSGALSREDFGIFFSEYKNTEQFYNGQFLKEGGVIAYGNDGFFSKIFSFLGLGSVAQAQLPLGGPVILQTICTCSFVGAITVGPPAGGSFALPPVFALFPNFSPSVGHFVLGLYDPSPIPCLQFAVAACIPDPLIPATLGPVIMLGTS